MSEKNCLICQSRENKVIFVEFGIKILKCRNCGHVFSSFDQVQNYNQYFNGLEDGDNYWWDRAHEKMYEQFCRRYLDGRSGKLLDAGCGLGYFVKKVSFRGGWQAIGYEIAEPAVKFAREKLGLKNVFAGRVEEAKFNNNYFDIITLWDVVEHLPNSLPMLKYLYSVLRDDGLLFIHTPNIKPQLLKAKIKKLFFGMKPSLHYLEARDHINIYSPTALKKILTAAGFKKIKFLHLCPIQAVAGSGNGLKIISKNLLYNSLAALDYLTRGKINLDNLFVEVRK